MQVVDKNTILACEYYGIIHPFSSVDVFLIEGFPVNAAIGNSISSGASALGCIA
jgi:hypothetical protein